MTTEGQPVTDGRPPLDPLVAAHDKGWSEGYMAGKAAAGLAQGRAEGLDVERHREAVSRSLRQFGKHPWWPPTIDLSDTILTEYAALTETPVEPVRCKPKSDDHWLCETHGGYFGGRASGGPTCSAAPTPPTE